MSGKELTDLIETPTYERRKGQNAMGCSEAYYDPCYLIYRAFDDAGRLEELRKKQNIDDLLLVATFATEAFY